MKRILEIGESRMDTSRWRALWCGLALCSVGLVSHAGAQNLGERRAIARAELAPLFFNKFVSINGALTNSSGPEFWENTLGTPFIGCPIVSFEPSQDLSLQFTTSGAGPVAGDLDGYNVAISTISGLTGGSLAIPSNTTGPSSPDYEGPQFSFFFDQTQNVARAAIDRAADAVDQCVRALPPGNYPGNLLSQLCPYPEIPVNDRRQTCVMNTYGDITEPLPDGTGYKVVVRQQMLCDGVGYGRPQPNNTSWLSCYQSTYEGRAEIVAGRGGARVAQIRSASNAAVRSCRQQNPGNSRKALRKVANCASKNLARHLVRRSR